MQLALSTTTSWALSYQEKLDFLGLEGLDSRRSISSLTFAKRRASKSRHQDLFLEVQIPHNIRGARKKYREPKASTTAYRRSVFPALPGFSPQGKFLICDLIMLLSVDHDNLAVSFVLLQRSAA